MLTAILILATFAAPTRQIDVLEINETPRITQAIYWRWHPQLRNHHVAQWHLQRSELLVTWHGGKRIVWIGDERFSVRSLRFTRTAWDRELKDRECVGEDGRRPYTEMQK